MNKTIQNPSNPAARGHTPLYHQQPFMRFIKTFLIGLTLTLSFGPTVALAVPKAYEQQALNALRQLYTASLQRPDDEALEQRILTEREKFRLAEIKDLTALVGDAAEDAKDKAPTVSETLATLRERISSLEALRAETRVDLDLLAKEESVLPAVTDPAQQPQRDKDRGSILARRAVLEERLEAIEEVLDPQQDRLRRLEAQERTEVFAKTLNVAFYVGLLALLVFAERQIRKHFIGRIRDSNRRYFAMKVFTITVYSIVLGWLLFRLFADYPGIITSFAIVGAGVALALQAVIKDIVGWIIIMQRRLFTLGQRITIGPHTGDVADISLLRTTLVEVANSEMEDAGRAGQTLHIPNSMVLDRPVLNYHTTSDYMETDLAVTVVFETDAQRVESILLQILEEHVGEFAERARWQAVRRTAHFFAPQEPPGPRVFIDIGLRGIVFTLRFPVPIGKRRGTVTQISREILKRFAQATPPVILARAP